MSTLPSAESETCAADRGVSAGAHSRARSGWVRRVREKRAWIWCAHRLVDADAGIRRVERCEEDVLGVLLRGEAGVSGLGAAQRSAGTRKEPAP